MHQVGSCCVIIGFSRTGTAIIHCVDSAPVPLDFIESKNISSHREALQLWKPCSIEQCCLNPFEIDQFAPVKPIQGIHVGLPWPIYGCPLCSRAVFRCCKQRDDLSCL